MEKKNAKYIFLTATLDATIWGAEPTFGDGRERIYLVEQVRTMKEHLEKLTEQGINSLND